MSLRQIYRVILTLALIGTASLVAQSPASAATQGPYLIQGLQSAKCVDVPQSSVDNVVIDIYTCYSSATNEKWYFDDTTDGYYRIRSQSSGKCLTVQNASTADYARIIQYSCVGGTNAEWRAYQVGTGTYDWYYLINRKSGKCLTVLNASTANNAPLMQYSCGGQAYNNWWTWGY